MSQANDPIAAQAAPAPIGNRLRPGDPAPMFRTATDTNPRYVFDTIAGRYIILAFLCSASQFATADADWNTLRQAQQSGMFDGVRAAAFVVSVDPADDAPRLRDMLPGLRVFRDRDGSLSRLYGAASQPTAGEGAYSSFALLLDPLLRVIATAPGGRVGDLLDVLGTLPPPALHAGTETPAPVLVLPRVLEPAFCAHLVALYEAQGGGESGFMREIDGRTVGMLDPAMKLRKDLTIEDASLTAQLRTRLARRLVPEMLKAFQFNATRIERYIVACYDAADGGHFRAHRDNTTPKTVHRRFAVTINLNDDFDGGELWFPEFGPRRYRPPIGCAVVFSCSLLHEATRVTRGRRYATLPFLFDEAAATVREHNLRLAAETETRDS